MPPIGPIKRAELIRYLWQLGFEGPFSTGGKHQVMQRGKTWVRIPNPHRGDISVHLLGLVLQRAGVSRAEWEAL